MRLGLVGWRGMVGSVLIQRMVAEEDFDGLETRLFSTSSAGALGPDVGVGRSVLLDAYDLDALAAQQVIITCQGGGYTSAVFERLRSSGWRGIWIDAASTLRLDPAATLVLDPVNGAAVVNALHDGCRTFVGANCTVSLMLMGLGGLIRAGHVEWISSMTYQAASGAGARAVRELIEQMQIIGDGARDLLTDPSSSALQLDRRVGDVVAAELPVQEFGAPLAGSALPWIDRLMPSGQTREEYKGMVEASKLLGHELLLDGLCVRIGALRCHAQALTIKLNRAVPLDDVRHLIESAHPWVDVVPNERQASIQRLTPTAVAGTLRVPVGRLRPMILGDKYLTCFTVGDQLLWGAAEPLRRMLRIVRESNSLKD
jgi:aspartate-semialdehyde dehydrogenase